MQAAQAANSALQNEIMLLQARLTEQNEALQRTRYQENMSAPGPADRTQRRDTPAENHVTGELCAYVYFDCIVVHGLFV